MPQLSYEDYMNQKQKAADAAAKTQSTNYLRFFALKYDKQEAIVRIMHDSPADYDIAVVHSITQNGKKLKVNCLRDASEPIDSCPACAANIPLEQKVYIHLLEYTKDENGAVICTPKIWERSESYIDKLNGWIAEYGPLSDSLFKIRRDGQPGQQDTTYEVMYANPMVYKSDIYVKDNEAFKNVKAVGTVIRSKTADEMRQMIGVDENLEPQSNTNPVLTSPAIESQTTQSIHTNTYVPANQSVEPQPRTYNPMYPGNNDGSALSDIARPRRFY